MSIKLLQCLWHTYFMCSGFCLSVTCCNITCISYNRCLMTLCAIVLYTSQCTCCLAKSCLLFLLLLLCTISVTSIAFLISFLWPLSFSGSVLLIPVLGVPENKNTHSLTNMMKRRRTPLLWAILSMIYEEREE